MSIEPQVAIEEKKVTETPPVAQATEQTKQPESENVALSEANKVNWKQFREEREKERKEKEEANKRAAEESQRAAARQAEVEALKAALSAVVQKKEPEYDASEESEEVRIEKKVNAALEKRLQKDEEDRQKREIAEIPRKLQGTFSDFSQVVSQENIDYLEYHYPEVHQGFKNAKESYETWAALYKTIKRFVPNLDSKKEAARIDKNLSKPQSMSQAGMSSTGDSAPRRGDITEEKRLANWARMQKTIKGMK